VCRKVRSTPDTVAKVFCVTEYAANDPHLPSRDKHSAVSRRAFRRKSLARADAGTIRAVTRIF
jgi:hypothetical protein